MGKAWLLLRFHFRETPRLQKLQNLQKGVERTRGELRDVVSYAARWTELAWRISVNLHAGEHGAEAHTQKLSPETARRAIEIADWFAAEQLKILKAGRTKRKLARLQKLKELIVRHYNGKATLRDLNIRNGFESGEVHELAVIFPGNLVIEKLETGGRPSEIVSLCQK